MPESRKQTRIIILGSTGSIGTATLDVIEHLNSQSDLQFKVVGLAAGSQFKTLAQQAKRFDVQNLAIASHQTSNPPSNGTQLFTGPNAACQLVQEIDADLIVAAIVGSAGLSAVVAGIERGCDIALANKETLVAAGALVMPLARRHGVRILPVDSEHSAILQCLLSNHATDVCDWPLTNAASTIRRLVLTASGGPFRTWPVEKIAHATREQALSHPTWTMGAKITIDSASMTNKALEIIEAHYLFGLRSEQIDVLVHPQSIVHGLVEFVDGSTIAQLGAPDMRTPIQLALTWPKRTTGCDTKFDLLALQQLDFEPADPDRFPALHLARRVLSDGGTSGAIMNAANEAAVAAFLDQRIAFGRIAELMYEAMDAIPSSEPNSLDDIFSADRAARQCVAQRLARVEVAR